MLAWARDRGYRSALVVLAGISTVYGFYLLHQHYLALGDSRRAGAPIRRRNAVRQRQRPRYGPVPLRSVRAGPSPTSESAIAAVIAREVSDSPYGYISISLNGRLSLRRLNSTREDTWPLLPYTLPTVSHVEGIEMRRFAEEMFVTAFLGVQFAQHYTINDAESEYLQQELASMGLDPFVIESGIQAHNRDPDYGSDFRRAVEAESSQSHPTGRATELERMQTLLESIDRTESDAEGRRSPTRRRSRAEISPHEDGQNTLNLLYNIAADQARKNGYIHRGIECDHCGMVPIQGIRFRCANCIDFDLCESCEAQDLHLRTHVFYKLRIPAPSLGRLGNDRQALPLLYPGKASVMPSSLSRALQNRLLDETGFDHSEFDALWDQFRCLASTHWHKDPNSIGMAIDRKTFDRFFVPAMSHRPAPPTIIYDRIFAFYDSNHDGLIGFEEFLRGLANLNDKSRDGRLRRIFNGYDIDSDGYVDRKDFLRIFRAYYILSKDLNQDILAHDMLANMEEDIGDIVRGSQPISAGFFGEIPHRTTDITRAGVGKQVNACGDMVIADDGGVFRKEVDDENDRNLFIGHGSAERPERPPETTRMPSRRNSRDGAQCEPAEQNLTWPPSFQMANEDVICALGQEIPLENITSPDERSRVVHARSQRIDAEWRASLEERRSLAIQQRWQRRAFYTDVEEGASAPSDMTGLDDSGSDYFKFTEHGLDSRTSASGSRPISPRSRSSSKVRFEDNVADTDYETRSNTSSRSIPMGERWGGYDISEVEKDAGREILYQTIQQGLNELLDQLFKKKEDLAMEAQNSRALREDHAEEIRAYSRWLHRQPGSQKQQAEDGENETKRSNSKIECLHGGLPEMGPSQQPQSKASLAPAAKVDPMMPNTLRRDPTLPQFLPNDPNVVANASHNQSTSSRTTLFGHPPNYNHNATEIYNKLMCDEQAEKEASRRGGFGRLNFEEFSRNMCDDDDDDDDDEVDDDEDVDDENIEPNHEDQDKVVEEGDDMQERKEENHEAAASTGASNRSANNSSTVNDGDEAPNLQQATNNTTRKRKKKKRNKKWSSSGGMGKLSFVGTWLEMPNF